MNEHDRLEKEYKRLKAKEKKSALDELLSDIAYELNEEAGSNMVDAGKELENNDQEAAIAYTVIAGVLNGIAASLLRAYDKEGR